MSMQKFIGMPANINSQELMCFVKSRDHKSNILSSDNRKYGYNIKMWKFLNFYMQNDISSKYIVRYVRLYMLQDM